LEIHVALTSREASTIEEIFFKISELTVLCKRGKVDAIVHFHPNQKTLAIAAVSVTQLVFSVADNRALILTPFGLEIKRAPDSNQATRMRQGLFKAIGPFLSYVDFCPVDEYFSLSV
jgi:hypothetical protein